MIGEFEETAEVVGKQIKASPKSAVSTTVSQITGGPPKQNDPDKDDFVKKLYEKSEPEKNNSSANPLTSPDKDEHQTPEEAEKLAKLRQQLAQQHRDTYFDPTFNRKEKTQSSEEEEYEQEKKQEEEEKKFMELQKKEEEKQQTLSAQRAQQRVERERDVSG